MPTVSQDQDPMVQIAYDLATVEAYIGNAVGIHAVAQTNRFDPSMSVVTIAWVINDLLIARGHTTRPYPAVQTTSGAQAVREARTRLVAAADRIIELGSAETTTTPDRRLLASVGFQLQQAHQELFGEDW